MGHKLIKSPGKVVVQHQMSFLVASIFLILAVTVFLFGKSSSESESISMALCTLFLAGCCLVFCQSTIFEFDTVHRKLYYAKKLLFFELKNGCVDFDQLKDVQLRTLVDSEGSPSYKICVGAPDQEFEMTGLNDKQLAESLATEMNTTIFGPNAGAISVVEAPKLSVGTALRSINNEVQLSSDELVEVEKLIAARKEIEAIKLVRNSANVDLRTAKLFVDKQKRR